MALAGDLGPQLYEFRVAGELRGEWYDWLDGCEVAAGEGITVIRGCMTDQSSLYGMITHFAGVGLTLLSVSSLDSPRIP
jgi:hypothetical protein